MYIHNFGDTEKEFFWNWEEFPSQIIILYVFPNSFVPYMFFFWICSVLVDVAQVSSQCSNILASLSLELYVQLINEIQILYSIYILCYM